MATKPQLTEEQILEQAMDREEGELLPGLTKDLEQSLIGLVQEFERESYATWRFYVRDFLEAESFWKDIQTGWYDFDNDIWRVPTMEQLEEVGESGSRFDFVTNLYRAWGWALIAVLGQKLPTTRFLPQDYRQEQDVMASREASSVVPIVERNNRTNLLHLRATYLLYTHGICASYTRHLVDGERFGYREEPRFETSTVKVQDEGIECPECLQLSSIEEAFEGVCPGCGGALSPANYRPAESAEIPVFSGIQRTPKGQELITIHGGLEMRLPPWVAELSDCPYLGLVLETHASQLRQTYGQRAKGLTGGYGSGPYDTWDRFARLALIEPTVSYYATSNQNLVTFKRYWLRRSAFYMLEDEQRDKLLELFPDGAYVAFADPKKLLDARNESIDQHWRLCKAMEGAGMYTPALGSSGISIQKRTNVLMNYVMEWVEYGAAGMGTFANSNFVNVRALRKHRRAPGNIYPARVPANMPMGNLFYESKPQQIPGEIFRHTGELQRVGEFVTGAVPTVTGGTEMSLKPTTYLADREQALGRLFVPWSHLRTFWAETMLLGVREFAKHRTEDEHYAMHGLHGEIEGRTVALENLQGNFDAYPETNENFPQLWHQMQAMFINLMQSQDPFVQEILGHSNNIPFAKAMLGLPDLYVPGEDDRRKQEREISLLLRGQPINFDLQGQQMILPSVPIDEFEDDHAEHEETVKEWAVSPAGLEAKAQNPIGYQNVVAHGKMHRDYVQMMQTQALMATGGQPGPAEAGEPSAAPAMSPPGQPAQTMAGQKKEQIEEEVKQPS